MSGEFFESEASSLAESRQDQEEHGDVAVDEDI